MFRVRWLALTIAAAVLVLVATSTALLVFDPRVTSADALRTGGLAAGSVVGLYALWLNDRRRRVDEKRQELEHRRADLDGDRLADERFARAVELLGSKADQVRVGALHALTGLARNRPDYTQTVIDVLCSYLRRPFLHPRYDEAEWTQKEKHEAERNLNIRLTAQRLLADLLPAVGETDAPHYDLDLTGAVLEYFDPSRRQIGRLVLRYAQFYSSTRFRHCEIHGPAWFTGMKTGSGRLAGRFYCSDTVFHDRVWFSKTTFTDRVNFDRSRFHGPVKFADSAFAGTTSAEDAVFCDTVDLRDTTFSGDLYLSTTSWPDDVITTGMSVDTTQHVEMPDDWRTALTPQVSGGDGDGSFA